MQKWRTKGGKWMGQRGTVYVADGVFQGETDGGRSANICRSLKRGYSHKSRSECIRNVFTDFLYSSCEHLASILLGIIS